MIRKFKKIIVSLKFVIYIKTSGKVVVKRLDDYILDNNLYSSVQSAYRERNSTETALLKVQSDILTAFDSESGVVLLILDLSVAFDTIDHGILLSTLNSLYGISGDALDWFKSILSNCVRRVITGVTVSECKDLSFGVLQESVVRPKIYCMYTKPISDIIAGHGLSHHFYVLVDDTQLYIAIEHSANIHSKLLRMERCVADIRNWMRHNMLKLNDDKTELIVFVSRYNQHLYSDVSMMVGNTTVKNLSVIFDQLMSMRQHVNYTLEQLDFISETLAELGDTYPGVTMTPFRSHGRDASPISLWDLGSHTSAGNLVPNVTFGFAGPETWPAVSCGLEAILA